MNGLGAALPADGPHASASRLTSSTGSSERGTAISPRPIRSPPSWQEPRRWSSAYVAGLGGTRCARRGQRGRRGDLVSRVATVRGRAPQRLQLAGRDVEDENHAASNATPWHEPSKASELSKSRKTVA
jgi:hypothetical protein